MPSLSTLPTELQSEVIKYVVDREPEILIAYFARAPFQLSKYRDFRSLSLVNKTISSLATRELYAKSTFHFYRTDEYPGDLPVFLNGLRESTFHLISSITVEFPVDEESDFEAFTAGFALLWYQPLERLTITTCCSTGEYLPRLEDITMLFDFDKIKEFEYELPDYFYLTEERCRELVDTASDALDSADKALLRTLEEVKNVLEKRQPRTRSQQDQLEVRRTCPKYFAVSRDSSLRKSPS